MQMFDKRIPVFTNLTYEIVLWNTALRVMDISVLKPLILVWVLTFLNTHRHGCATVLLDKVKTVVCGNRVTGLWCGLVSLILRAPEFRCTSGKKHYCCVQVLVFIGTLFCGHKDSSAVGAGALLKSPKT
jgi:hypothetical protein